MSSSLQRPPPPRFLRQDSTVGDEESAMESIFDTPESFRVVIKNDQSKQYLATIEVSLPHETIELVVDGCAESLLVSSLPPIHLCVTIDSSYPASRPPFTLSCSWLSAVHLECLAHLLDAIYNEDPGNVVVFPWVDNLRCETFNHLDLRAPVVVPADQGVAEDPRVLVRTGAPMEPTMVRRTLADYDMEASAREWLHSFHACDICMREVVGKDSMRLVSCRHGFCHMCLATMVRTEIRDGDATRVNCGCVCPASDCGAPLLPTEIAQLLKGNGSDKDKDNTGEEEDGELYARYERLVLDKCLADMQDIVWCARHECQRPVMVDTDSPTGRCTFCGYVFCTRCRREYHSNLPCSCEFCKLPYHFNTPCRDSMTDTLFINGSWTLRRQLIAAFGPKSLRLPATHVFLRNHSGDRDQLRALFGQSFWNMAEIEELESEQTIDAISKRCPTCSTPIQKNQGCSHMKCRACGTDFCWECLEICPSRYCPVARL